MSIMPGGAVAPPPGMVNETEAVRREVLAILAGRRRLHLPRLALPA